MAMSNFLEDTILEMVLNSVAYSEPASVWIALYTAAPNDAGGGTEVTGGSYVRKQLTTGFTVSGTATRGGNTATITFPTATADWGTVEAIGIFDAIAGNLLLHGSLTTPRLVESGDIFSFAADALGITLS